MDTNVLNTLVEQGIEIGLSYGPKLLLAIATLFVGFWLVRIISRALARWFERKDYDPSLETFLHSFIGIALKVLVVITVAGMIGIEMTAFIAVLGAAGLAVGFALQGSLSNFAGGVLILIFKPFTVDDVIEYSGNIGVVKKISIINTHLSTGDNRTIIIPNGPLANGVVTNYTHTPERRLDIIVGIGYDDDIQKAKEVLKQIAIDDERILEEPDSPFVGVHELGDSAVNMILRIWCENENYWALYFDLREKVKLALDDVGISIPYPQRDVHMKKD